MPRRNRNAFRGGNHHSRGSGAGWMKRKKGGGDHAPLTPGQMHSKTRLRKANG